MAKANFKNLNKVLKNIEKVFDDTLTNELMSDIGSNAVNRIKGYTRKGYSLPRVDKRTLTTTQSPKRQQPLSKGYIEYRLALQKGLIKRGQPGYVKTSGSFFKVSFSNLTLTGQLIDSIKYAFGKVRKRSKTIEIDVSGNRDDGLTNKEVADELANMSDPRLFLGLDGKGIRVIRQKVLRLLRRNIRNFNK